MNAKRIIVVGAPLIALFLCVAVPRAYPEAENERVVRMAELEIYPDQVKAYKEELKKEIEASIRLEPGVLTLYAVSVKGQPEQIRRFEVYRNEAGYQAHLQLAHFRRYKQQTQQMVKTLKLVETEPVLLGTKLGGS